MPSTTESGQCYEFVRTDIVPKAKREEGSYMTIPYLLKKRPTQPNYPITRKLWQKKM